MFFLFYRRWVRMGDKIGHVVIRWTKINRNVNFCFRENRVCEFVRFWCPAKNQQNLSVIMVPL